MFLLPALLIGAAAVAGPTPPSACAGRSDVSTPVVVQKQALRCLVNATRTSAGLSSLRASRRLNRAAALRGAAIRRCNQFSHRPCGQSFVGVFVRAGYLGSGEVGENLAWGQAPLGTASDALGDWLTSPEHRSNLLDPGWRDVGVAVVKAPSLFGAENVTLWVIDFGRHDAGATRR